MMESPLTEIAPDVCHSRSTCLALAHMYWSWQMLKPHSLPPPLHLPFLKYKENCSGPRKGCIDGGFLG